MTRPALLTAVCLLAAVSPVAQASAAATLPPCCPTEAVYIAAVRAFASGDRAAALVAVEHAPADQIMRAVSRMSRRNRRLLEAAAVLHLILADRALHADDFEAVSLNLRASDKAFQKIRRSDEVLAFMGRWFAAATELWVATGDFGEAALIVHGGLVFNALHAQVALAQGIMYEANAESDDHRALDWTAVTALPARHHLLLERQVTVFLGYAERAYRDAIDSDPAPTDKDEARLRLGRVLTLEGKDAQARRMLERAAGVSRHTRIVYLAHLFLADLDVRRKDARGAAAEYQAAIAADPASRVARIGLANLAQRSGDDERAREDIREWVALETAPRPGPWRLYQMGIDQLTPRLIALARMVPR